LGPFLPLLAALRGHIPDPTLRRFFGPPTCITPASPLRFSGCSSWAVSFLDSFLSLSLVGMWSSHPTLTVRIVCDFQFILDGLLQLRPECANCGSHFCLARFDVFF
jgi:hypothetical protein